jgi:hypothetical protein
MVVLFLDFLSSIVTTLIYFPATVERVPFPLHPRPALVVFVFLMLAILTGAGASFISVIIILNISFIHMCIQCLGNFSLLSPPYQCYFDLRFLHGKGC